jgi:hypothetical protein
VDGCASEAAASSGEYVSPRDGTHEGRWGQDEGRGREGRVKREEGGYTTGGTRPHSCFLRAGRYTPLLVRHDLVAALHAARWRLSARAGALLSPLAARALAHGARVCAAARAQLADVRSLRPRMAARAPGARFILAPSSGFCARPGVRVPCHWPCPFVPALAPRRASAIAAWGYCYVESLLRVRGTPPPSRRPGAESRMRGAPSRPSSGPRAKLGGSSPVIGASERPFMVSPCSRSRSAPAVCASARACA